MDWTDEMARQGSGDDLPDPALAKAAMRPSTAFNEILDSFRNG